MSMVWLLVEIYLIGSFISAILILFACVLAERLPEKAPVDIAKPSKPNRALAAQDQKCSSQSRFDLVELTAPFSAFGI